jgi:hypothetical protein
LWISAGIVRICGDENMDKYSSVVEIGDGDEKYFWVLGAGKLHPLIPRLVDIPTSVSLNYSCFQNCISLA